MIKNKKTCNAKNINNKKQITQNKNEIKAKNITMKNKDIKNQCNMHVMPPQITEQDIMALFNGLIGVVKKKVELDTKAEILNANLNLQKVLKELKEKQSECIRLKNEIINLKAQINQNQLNHS